MAVHSIETLQQPFQSEKLLQIRTGKIKPVFGLPIPSAIFKSPRKGPVKITFLGCEGDQQAFEKHGGPDKALLHYCSRNYPNWQKELPQSSHLFTLGGFGENLVSTIANERNVCIGDIFAIGDEVLVQVTYPRQPCYKLNHRFEVKDMSRRSQTLARTGWYYRVLREGSICEGDEIRLERRINPRWTVADVQYYLYIEMRNEEVMHELVDLEGLGAEVKKIFRNRLDKQFENQDQRLVGGEEMAVRTWSDFKLVEKRSQTPRIVSLRFERVQPVESPVKVDPGSHIRIKLGKDLVRAYSIVAGDSNKFELGVALDAQSRGGSKFIHQVAREGEIYSLGEIRPSFPLSQDAKHHIIIAGGIGITAFIAAAQFLQTKKENYELHFAVRSVDDIPFKEYLMSRKVMFTSNNLRLQPQGIRLPLNVL